MGRDRFPGWLLVAAGLLGTLAIQVVIPTRQPPIYDGIVVVEPYLWLDPPPDHPGGASGSTAEIAVTSGRNDLVAAATAESPPQAQIFGISGSLVVGGDVTRISLSIQPVPTPATPSRGYIDGNVYRFDVTDQLGRTITARSDALVSIILRPADPGVRDPTIERFNGVEWEPVPTSEAGESGFEAIVTEFGDFAIVAAGVSPYPTGTGLPPTAAPLSGVPSASAAPRPGDGNAPDLGSLLPMVLLASVGLILTAVYVLRGRRRYTGPRGWGPHGDR